MECEVSAALNLLLEAAQRFSEKEVTELVQGQRQPAQSTALAAWPVNLQRYDALLQGGQP